jgi:eukaryotic-like serine/threonine-protein kinase
VMEETALLNNRYRLLHPQGTGGMAVVFKAIDEMLERTVAVKILKEDYAAEEDFRDRFRQEAKSAANLSHPNIVTVYDFGLDENQVFIVMEYINGTDLKSLIREKSRFSIEDTVGLMAQACAGVGYAHRAGLVHCDIKPHNMLVSSDFRLKVTDFGIARALATIHPDERTEVVWGSPHYFSPEQAGGEAPSPASDVYSLGVILYEMLTGKLPFEANESSELARMHRVEVPVPPRRLNPAIPEALEEITLKVLSKEPAARYRSADQLGRVLVNFGHLNKEKSGPIVLPKAGNLQPIKEEIENEGEGQFTAEPNSKETGSSLPVEHPNGQEVDEGQPLDWPTWLLALLAFTAVLGLVPFWLYIYFSFNP